ncbi:hypothetical protein F511_07986 [Dorcoceras hygrometricum]|uniref:Uncharacterized protein n=1 Tax=Dorcoceras hygrometricum TaxID=472368 RepID=A0A2Z7BHG3_9LAMI|nr:hypothetical protein F511_07986 [Dorcoceras hygrometricum]
MATFVNNALQVNFDSVLSMTDKGMVNMFRTLEESRLIGFLGVSGLVYEHTLTLFFENGMFVNGEIVSIVSGAKVVISKERFENFFKLPSEGILGFSNLPTKTVVDEQDVSMTCAPFRSSSMKKYMKLEYRLLNDIMAESLTAKVGSFDADTVERFDIMVEIIVGF